MAVKRGVVGWPADAVERRKVADLVACEANARTHSEEQVSQVAESIKEWGWTIPVLIDEAGMILAGHCRVRAAEKLGIVDVPVMVARGWPEAKKRAYVLADNKLALNAGWDFKAVSRELDALKEWGFDVSLTGFGEPEEIDYDAHWVGMPEFTQADKRGYKTLYVHFKDQAAVDAFAELIDQTITEKTQFIWFPEIEIERYVDKVYEGEDA